MLSCKWRSEYRFCDSKNGLIKGLDINEAVVRGTKPAYCEQAEPAVSPGVNIRISAVLHGAALSKTERDLLAL